MNKNTTDKTTQVKLKPLLVGGRPDFVLVYKNSPINLDSITLSKLDPKWIRRFKVLIEKDAQSIHTDVNGTVLIYPKRRFHDQIQTVLNK